MLHSLFLNIYFFNFLPDQIIDLPTDADLKGALVALLHLQRSYMISTQDLAEGKVM